MCLQVFSRCCRMSSGVSLSSSCQMGGGGRGVVPSSFSRHQHWQAFLLNVAQRSVACGFLVCDACLRLGFRVCRIFGPKGLRSEGLWGLSAQGSL